MAPKIRGEIEILDYKELVFIIILVSKTLKSKTGVKIYPISLIIIIYKPTTSHFMIYSTILEGSSYISNNSCFYSAVIFNLWS